MKPHLQNNQSKMNRKCGSSGRAPALQVPNPEFKPKINKNNKKTPNQKNPKVKQTPFLTLKS
jgi:hypothetical protein